jgi:hypothetical protein
MADGDLGRSTRRDSMHRHGTVAVAGSAGPVGRHVVEALEARGWNVVAISRARMAGVIDREVLDGVACVIDADCVFSAAHAPFLTTASRRAPGVERIVTLSSVNRFREAHFRELVDRLVDWGRRGEAGIVRISRPQLEEADALAEELVGLALGERVGDHGEPIDADEEKTLPAA